MTEEYPPIPGSYAAERLRLLRLTDETIAVLRDAPLWFRLLYFRRIRQAVRLLEENKRRLSQSVNPVPLLEIPEIHG
jgi:hypothetical protein